MKTFFAFISGLIIALLSVALLTSIAGLFIEGVYSFVYHIAFGLHIKPVWVYAGLGVIVVLLGIVIGAKCLDDKEK